MQPEPSHPDAPLWDLIHNRLHGGKPLADRIRMMRHRRVRVEQPLDEIAAMTDEQMEQERNADERDDL